MSAEVIPEFGSPKEHFCVLSDMLEVAMDVIKVPELPHQADIRLVYMSSLVDGWIDVTTCDDCSGGDGCGDDKNGDDVLQGRIAVEISSLPVVASARSLVLPAW